MSNEWVKDFEYELALDSYIDFSKLKWEEYSKVWYYTIGEIISRLNMVLGPNWNCKTSQPIIDQVNKFLTVNVDLEITIGDRKIVRSSLSGKSLNAGKKGEGLGNLDLISKGSASEALKKAASYFGVAYYLYNKDTSDFLKRVFSIEGTKMFLRENMISEANKKLVEPYDTKKMIELHKMFTESGKSADDWNEYVKKVNFMNIKSFIFSHNPKIKTIMWKNIYSKKIEIK